jgi:hypothetical protein
MGFGHVFFQSGEAPCWVSDYFDLNFLINLNS